MTSKELNEESYEMKISFSVLRIAHNVASLLRISEKK